MAAFLAQTGHESGGFYYLRELWGPTPSQTRYEGRADLGNTRPGDGRRFLGRGLIQITGRANYTRAAKAFDMSLDALPPYLETPEGAVRVSLWWWQANGCNTLADDTSQAGFEALTRRINGGRNGWSDRLDRWAKAEKALGVWP